MNHVRTVSSVLFALACCLALPDLVNAQYVHDWTIFHNSGGDRQKVLGLEVDRYGNTFIWGHRIYDWPNGERDFMVACYDKTGYRLFMDIWDNRWDESYDALDAACLDSSGNFYVHGHSYNWSVSDTLEVWLAQYNTLGRVGMVQLSEGHQQGELVADRLGNVFSVGGGAVALIRPGPTVAWDHQYAGPVGEGKGGYLVQVAVDNRGDLYTARTMGARIYQCGPGWEDVEFSLVLHRYSAYGMELEWIIDNTACTPCGLSEDCPDEFPSYGIGADTLGNCYVRTHSQTNQFRLTKYGSAGGEIWSIPDPTGIAPHNTTVPLLVDPGGNMYVSGNIGGEWLVQKFSADDGSFLWERGIPWDSKHRLEFGPHGTIFAMSDYTSRYTPEGDRVWDGWLPVDMEYWKRIGPDGCIYTLNVDSGELRRYHPRSILAFVSGDDKLMDSVEFQLIKIANDPPFFTEDTIGVFETDSIGRFEFEYVSADSFLFRPDSTLPGDTLAYGDTLKLAMYVTTGSAFKHQSLLNTTNSIYLDNARFDSLGAMRFDTLIDATRWIEMSHSEHRFNLLVSVEWDATEDYLYSLQAGLREMSNYLYDVTDGQMRLDTIMIFDDSEHWLEADMWIYASNDQHPRATYGGILKNFPGNVICFPRKWDWGPQATWDTTYFEHPLRLDEATNYRTYTHEFGHYALQLWDEYLFYTGLDAKGHEVYNKIRTCSSVKNFGFMDSQYPRSNSDSRFAYSSEMSSAASYSDLACRYTQQWKRNGKSCWDDTKAFFERKYSLVTDPLDTIFVPIVTPDDPWFRVLSDTMAYLPGPNEDMDNLDYDVGSMVYFPENVQSPAAGVRELKVELRIGAATVGGADVSLLKTMVGTTKREIKQGKTANNGRIWVLGAEVNDQILSSYTHYILGVPRSSAHVSTGPEWMYGVQTIVDPDQLLTMELQSVQGYYPVICDISLEDSTGHLLMTALNLFAVPPSLDLRPADRRDLHFDFEPAQGGYDAHVTTHPGPSGNITVWATDESEADFFFTTPYALAEFESSAAGQTVLGPGGKVDFMFDTTTSSVQRAFVLSSDYLTIRTGLEEASIQAGAAHSLAVYPQGSFTSSAAMIIRYTDNDIAKAGGGQDDEAALRVWHWTASGWELIGGSVDTIGNEVYATIDQPGVYAAFTQMNPTDVEDEPGSTLPYLFELSQNYPNPFNPATTIKYSLPQKSSVTIEVYNVLGQRVRTLVEREEAAGTYTVTWDGTDATGKAVATGVYLYRFQAGNHIDTKKMLLLK